jgi:hypothetical protein
VGGLLYIGSNDAGESGPTFLRAPTCEGAAQPTPVSELPTDEPLAMHWVLRVTGVPH